MYREYGQVVAVTNRSLTERPFLEQIRRVCEMHPDALILREKDLSEKEYEELAKKVMAICAEYKVPCILHTFWRVAEKLNVIPYICRFGFCVSLFWKNKIRKIKNTGSLRI